MLNSTEPRIQVDPEDTETMDPDDEAPLLHDGHDTRPDTESSTDDTILVQKSGLSLERIRLVRTVSMMMFYVCMGLCSGVISPATLDLMELFHCNLEQLSLMLTSRSVGLLIGSFVGGTVSNMLRNKADLFLTMMGVLIGTSMLVIPWCPHLWIASIPLTLAGLAHGSINVVCSSTTIAEWGEKAPVPINFLHFAFSVGTLIAPPTVAPFLSKQDSNSTNTTEHKYWQSPSPRYGEAVLWKPIQIFDDWPNNDFQESQYNETSPLSDLSAFNTYSNSTINEKSRIYIPFAAYGAVGICAGILFFAYYLAGWKYQSALISPELPRESSPEGRDGTNRLKRNFFKIIMGFSLFLVYIGIVTRDMSISRFIYYISVKGPLHITKTRAAILNTVNNASWVVGRLLGIVLAKIMKIHYLVFTGIIGVLVISIFLIFFGFKAEVALWCLTCAMGIFAGPCYPSVMAWADRYIEMDGIMVGLVDIGIASGGFMSQYVGGHIIHHYGTVYAFVLCASGSAYLLTVMIALQIFCCMRGDRFKRQPLMDVNDPSSPETETINDTEAMLS